jgi:hypothetical protein
MFALCANEGTPLVLTRDKLLIPSNKIKNASLMLALCADEGTRTPTP